MLPERLHVFGASGSGTTTLGALIAECHGHRHLDTDDFFWEATDPPYTDIRPVEVRLRRLRTAMEEARRWVLSGSLSGWGDPLAERFDLAIFLSLDAGLRLARLRAREELRWGREAIAPGGPRHDAFQTFMAWASRYDEGGLDVRSRAVHEAWIAKLPCPVLRLDAALPAEDLLRAVEARAGR